MEPTSEGWLFEKTFQAEDYIAGGFIELPLGATKKQRSTRDNTYVRGFLQGGNETLKYVIWFRYFMSYRECLTSRSTL